MPIVVFFHIFWIRALASTKQDQPPAGHERPLEQAVAQSKILIENGLFLEDIAAQTGFGDYSGFYRAFKQEYGISPRQYRKVYEGSGKNKEF